MEIALHCMYECRWMFCTDGYYTWPQWVVGCEESTDTFVDGWCLLLMQHHWPRNRLRLRVSGKGAMRRSLERWIFLCWEKLWCSMFASLHTLTLFLTRCLMSYTHFILRIEDKKVQITLKIRLSVYCKRCLRVLLQLRIGILFFLAMVLGDG